VRVPRRCLHLGQRQFMLSAYNECRKLTSFAERCTHQHSPDELPDGGSVRLRQQLKRVICIAATVRSLCSAKLYLCIIYLGHTEIFLGLYSEGEEMAAAILRYYIVRATLCSFDEVEVPERA
jgi:hypothetical protein